MKTIFINLASNFLKKMYLCPPEKFECKSHGKIRTRIYSIQSWALRRDREFLSLNLRDENKNRDNVNSRENEDTRQSLFETPQ